MKGMVIIPARDEEDSLPLVLSDLLDTKLFRRNQIIVVDNGSKDKTGKIAREWGVICLYEPERGYGAACQRGLKYIQKNKYSPEWILFLDADYSDYVEDVETIVTPIEEGKQDFVTGWRVIPIGQENPFSLSQRFGNALVCKLIQAFFRVTFQDLGSLRAIRYKSLLLLDLKDKTWGWNVEMNIRAIQKKLRIQEVPVRYRARYAGKSKISGNYKAILPVGFKILFTFFKLLIKGS